MRMRTAAVVTALLLGTTGCAEQAGAARSTSALPQLAESLVMSHPGSLSGVERAVATRLARHQQRNVTGTFIGATAFVTRGTPFDPGSECDVVRAVLNVRLVWKADAKFVHSFPPGAPPDGPRKALLASADPRTGKVCEIAAMYRDVGAHANETLLYGEWPDPTDG